ncbi:MAG: 50S ribosomal protein L5 [Verrucomicrobia bacterium]|jgi:large subunit ribosomal protein L5|nr:50S ribosomal protein L5 [Verrucomicrobiota bacterium]
MQSTYLQQYYKDEVVPALRKSRGYTNIHEVPAVEKVVLNTGFSAGTEKGQIDDIVKEMSQIAGQRPVVTKARKSVSNFKLREGMPIGAKVTLRGATMYDFLYRLIAVALPGIRDFRGVRDRLDGNGNYTLGISDISIFPEVRSDSGKGSIGMDICISTTATTDEEGRELLQQLGVPFRKRSASTATASA